MGIISQKTLATIAGGLLLILSLSINVQAQTGSVRFKHITGEEGLPHNSIYSILQDKVGFMWFGTYNGLSKYDGYEFTIYKHDLENSLSLSHNAIISLYEDHKGYLWIGTVEGLNRFDHITETFVRYFHDPSNPKSLSGNAVNAIYEDLEGDLWIGTEEGLNRFDHTTEIFVRYFHDPSNPESLSGNAVSTIYVNHGGEIWIGTRFSGLNRFDRDTEQFVRYQPDPNNSYSLSSNYVNSIREDFLGQVWIGTPNEGVNVFDRETQQFIHYQHDPTDSNSLNDNRIRSLFIDRSGGIWIGTKTGGLNIYNRLTEQFAHYQHDPTNSQSLSNNVIFAIYEDQSGILWIGTQDGGLNKFDRKTETFTHYLHEPSDPLSLSDNNVRAIYEDQSGILWIGTQDGGLNRFDRKTETFTHYLHEPSDPLSLSHNNVSAIAEDRTGTLWIGTRGGGLNRFDRNGEKFTHYQFDSLNPRSLSDNYVISIYEDSSGTLWIGTEEGINKFYRTDETFTYYRDKDGLPNNVIYGIMEDTQGNLWFSTNLGISKFNPRLETFRNYDKTDGLRNDEFNTGAYYKTQDGMMLFGGFSGICAFYPERIVDNPYVPPVVITDFQIFNRPVLVGGNDSPIQNPISQTNSLTLSFRESVFSFGFAALSYVDPEKNQYAYRMDGFENDWNYVASSRRFATYTNLDPGTYIFRVKGSNNDGVWNEEGASIYITVTSPWWATWWFRLLAVISFIGIMFIAIQVRIKGMESKRLQQEIKERKRIEEALRKLNEELEDRVRQRTVELEAVNEELKALDRRKSDFLSTVSHELRTPLTPIKGYIENLLSGIYGTFTEKQAIRAEMALACINDEARLVENLLDLVRIQENRVKLNWEPGNIADIVYSVIQIFDYDAKDKGVKIKAEIRNKDSLITHLDKGKIKQVLTNLVHNALKFTPQGGTITILAFSEDNSIKVRVADTGTGIPDKQLEKIFDRFYQVDSSLTRKVGGTGIGLNIVKKYIELHDGKIWVESTLGIGSTFTFTLPQKSKEL